ncbi:aspartyl protease family protein [Luteimonas salinilitoris]|uniref:Aspartyl protease family protein n=1 Tax=Luteimonas salinilitoris TaxID=3237697 RepID=A0ABV4HWL4_9GAMM
MSKSLKVLIFGELAACLLGANAFAQEPVITLTPPEGAADRALAEGDVRALDALMEEAVDSVERELVAAYKARAEARLGASDVHALRCSELARADIVKNYASEAKCRALLAGNKLIAGDMASWVTLMRNALVAVEDHAREEAHRIYPGKFTRNAQVALPGAAMLPRIDSGRPEFRNQGTSEVLKRVPYLDQGISPEGVPKGPYSIQAKANGELADFVFDTGAHTLIGGELARRLNIDLDSGWGGNLKFNMYLEGRQVRTQLVTLESIQFGSFEAKNITVLVSEDPSLPNIIGFNLIQHMKPFRLTETQLEMTASSSCDSTFSIGSDTTGGRVFLVASVDINGVETPADIDTGNPGLMMEFNAPVVAPWDVESQQVTVNGLRGTVARGDKGSEYGTSHNVGAGILAGSDLYMDFAARRLCFEPRSDRR